SWCPRRWYLLSQIPASYTPDKEVNCARCATLTFHLRTMDIRTRGASAAFLSSARMPIRQGRTGRTRIGQSGSRPTGVGRTHEKPHHNILWVVARREYPLSVNYPLQPG